MKWHFFDRMLINIIKEEMKDDAEKKLQLVQNNLNE